MNTVSGRTERVKMTQAVPAVFLVDVDDTLLENDRIQDLGASQRRRVERPNSIHLRSISWYLADYLFDRPYRGTLDVLKRFRARGPTTGMLSDGDIVFRPRQVGAPAFRKPREGHVLFYVHKKKALDDVQRRYPADCRVRVDAKLRILTVMKKAWGEHGTAVFLRQEKFAPDDPAPLASNRPPDNTVESIAGLLAGQRSIPSTTEVTR
jgi:hypothetical protein